MAVNSAVDRRSAVAAWWRCTLSANGAGRDETAACRAMNDSGSGSKAWYAHQEPTRRATSSSVSPVNAPQSTNTSSWPDAHDAFGEVLIRLRGDRLRSRPRVATRSGPRSPQGIARRPTGRAAAITVFARSQHLGGQVDRDVRQGIGRVSPEQRNEGSDLAATRGDGAPRESAGSRARPPPARSSRLRSRRLQTGAIPPRATAPERHRPTCPSGRGRCR